MPNGVRDFLRNCLHRVEVACELRVADPARVQSSLSQCRTEPWRDQLRFKPTLLVRLVDVTWNAAWNQLESRVVLGGANRSLFA